jgi:hypothetical protein
MQNILLINSFQEIDSDEGISLPAVTLSTFLATFASLYEHDFPHICSTLSKMCC